MWLKSGNTQSKYINLVVDCDSILVLSNGEAIECGNPHELLCNAHSNFSSLVDSTGVDNAQVLRQLAKKEAELKGNTCKVTLGEHSAAEIEEGFTPNPLLANI